MGDSGKLDPKSSLGNSEMNLLTANQLGVQTSETREKNSRYML